MRWPTRSLGRAHGSLVHDRRVRVLARHLAELLPTAHSVLDVGCGDGRVASLLLERRPDLRVAGTDVLVRPGSRIPVVAFDGIRLPYRDRSWDTLLFCDVLHHTASPVALLREAVRVARSHVLIKDHFLDGFLARPTLRLMDFVGNAPHGVTLPYNYFSASEWEKAYRDVRLRPNEMRTRLGLYPAWADIVFGRSLHFIVLCEIERDSAP